MEFPLQQIGVAVVLAFLIGLEREQKGQKDARDHFGGVRTFSLIGVLGAVSQILYKDWIVVSAFVSFGVVATILASYWMSFRKGVGLGMTSEVAALLVFVLGFLSGMENYVLATGLALITLALLHFKEPLHNLAKRLKDPDVVATIKFILIAFIILPLLPNESYGPYGFFNPYTVWLMVVLISGISYLSYIGIKFLGARRGIGLTGFLAGFISSTALVLSFSGQSKSNKGVVNPYVVAVVIASSAMFFRVLVEVAVVAPGLLSHLIWPMGAMGATGLIGAGYFWWRGGGERAGLDKEMKAMDSPFQLVPALQFGGFFVAVLFISSLAKDFFGNSGIYVTSVVSGLMDVDAITVSMSNLFVEGEIASGTAVTAISLAAMTNTVVKGGIFMALGARPVALRIVGVFAVIMLVGAGMVAAGF